MEPVGPQRLSEHPQESFGKEALGTGPYCGHPRPQSSPVPRYRQEACHPLPGPHLPAATAIRPRPVSGLGCCLVRGPSPDGK